ncbi:MAG: glycoside hydrolase family 15 protein [Alphaproteobacteria bacterium]
MNSLDLGMIGNCSFAALVDKAARVVWCCLPRFDGDAVFNALMRNGTDPDAGAFSIELHRQTSSEQSYAGNTAILKTRLHGEEGSIEITDFAPRFYWRGRAFRPLTIVRRIRPISGSPRIRVKLRPTFGYGAEQPRLKRGSNHICYCGADMTLRLTTDAAIDYVLRETLFNLTEPVDFLLGPDETLEGGTRETAREFEERTTDYWRSWSQRLALPLEWQEAVMRAAVTLKMCSYEETGAVIAAATTSIPEAPDSGRNWDYRFCWVRDAYFVVRALNSLAAVRTMENYFGWIMNVVASSNGGHIQPVFGVGLETELTESIAGHLPGYRGMGPVRIGNQAYEHRQHDVYGNVVLGAAQVFFDSRMTRRRPALTDFWRLEQVGEQAYRIHDQPDAGMWELRTRARIHTSSSLMCWAACDRLAKVAAHLGRRDRETFWRGRAEEIRNKILDAAWSDKRRAFVESFGGEKLDASVLLMTEIGFLEPDHPRFVSTVERISDVLADGAHVRRYEEPDDFGLPETAFNICAFWRLDALARMGRREEAREMFTDLLSYRNHVGLLSEDTDPRTGELWGNFPQTYSMVGIINSAMRLSKPWESVV